MKGYLLRSYKAVVVAAWMGIIATSRLYAQGAGSNGGGQGGQPPPASSSQSTYIVYNYKYAKVNPDAGSFPIDRPFTFEIDSIPSGKIFKVYVFAVNTVAGERKLALPNHSNEDHPYPSFELKGKDTVWINGGIILRMPAVKPEVKFDIAIVKAFSPKNIATALALNKMLSEGTSTGDYTLKKGQFSIPDPGKKMAAQAKFDEFLTAVNGYDKYSGNKVNYLKANYQNGDKSQGTLGPFEPVSLIEQYYTFFYAQVKDDYECILNTSSVPDTPPVPADRYVSIDFFTPSEISKIYNELQHASNQPARLFLLRKILDQESFSNILTGLSGIDVDPSATEFDKYDFNARIKNIENASKFLDSVRNALYLVESNNTTVLDSLISKTSELIDDLNHNHSLIKRHYNSISDQLTISGSEDVWVSGQYTASPDMATISSRKLGVNFGETNIFARDNYGKLNCIPKFSWGWIIVWSLRT